MTARALRNCQTQPRSEFGARSRYYLPGSATTLFRPGQGFSTWVNQADREAMVLARIAESILYEYEMPNGTSSLKIWNLVTQTERNVQYKRVPRKWLQAIADGGEACNIIGNPQQSVRSYKFDDEACQFIEDYR